MADNAERRITMLERLERTAPYNVFFNVVEKSPETAKKINAIQFKDLLCPSLGSFKCALLTTLNLNVKWLLSEYEKITLLPPTLTILVDNKDTSFHDEAYPSLTVIEVQLDNDNTQTDYRSRHHSKLGLFVYDDDSLRVMVSTANLTSDDWLNCNQGLWLSPRLPKLPMNDETEHEPLKKKPKLENDEAATLPGESPTGFKSDFIKYLTSYRESSQLTSWINYVKNADFSEVRVAFIYSVPGKHEKCLNGSHLRGMENMLSKHYNIPLSDDGVSWDIIAQASSFGKLKKRPSEWLEGEFLRIMTSQNTLKPQTSGGCLKPNLKFIFPSERTVEASSSGRSCLLFLKKEYKDWLRNYLCDWKANALDRTKIMPHIKTYCRVSSNCDKIGYYLLTSANLSQGAWGTPWSLQNARGKKTHYNILHYEAGVLFLPKFFEEEYFAVRETEKSVPIMYDFPLVSYSETDKPGGGKDSYNL